MEPKEGAIILGLLEAVAAEGTRTQRHLASELGIALGLVNAYLKRCVKMGLVKVTEAPARRYAYYLTPQGFAEKSRLTVEYLSDSFSFFRRARGDCADVFTAIRAGGFSRVALAGHSDLAEIALICSLDTGVAVAAIVDPVAALKKKECAGVPVIRGYDAMETPFDAVIVTALRNSSAIYADARKRFGTERVFAPKLLGILAPTSGEDLS